MTIPAFFDSAVYTWVVLPIFIFTARIMDVSLDTVRIIFVNRNLKYFAMISGFFQVLIWLMVIRQIFQQLDNPICYVAYAAGFAAGNYVGLFIENKLSIGKVILRVITRKEADRLVDFLKSSGYGLTVLDAEGMTGPVKIIFTIVERSDIDTIVKSVKEFNPHAFYTLEDVRLVSEAVTPYRLPSSRKWFGRSAP